MKGVLEFDLDDNLDQQKFKQCSNASNAFLTLWELWNELVMLTDKGQNDITCCEVIEILNDIAESNGVDFYE